MRRQIDHTQEEEQEGLLYDLERAEKEGVLEELTFTVEHEDLDEPVPYTVFPEAVMEAFIDHFDLGVNVEPGNVQEIYLTMRYVYDYGQLTEEELNIRDEQLAPKRP